MGNYIGKKWEAPYVPYINIYKLGTQQQCHRRLQARCSAVPEHHQGPKKTCYTHIYIYIYYIYLFINIYIYTYIYARPVYVYIYIYLYINIYYTHIILYTIHISYILVYIYIYAKMNLHQFCGMISRKKDHPPTILGTVPGGWSQPGPNRLKCHWRWPKDLVTSAVHVSDI